MKKILLSLFVLSAFCITFASCSDDDDNDNTIISTNPEQLAAGTYTGTWTQDLNGTQTTAEGSIIVTADSAYCADFNFVCDEFGITGTSVANISCANSGFVYYNNAGTATGIGVSFSGRIDASGNITAGFEKSVRVGRKSTTYYFSFAGTKQ